MMKKNILTGALAAREYIHFFRDPIGCMRTLHRQRGKLVALGPIAFGEPTKLHVLAIGPEFISQWTVGRRDVYADMRAVTLRIASAVLFGHEASDAYRIARLLDIWARRNFSGPVWFFPINIPGTPYHRLLKHAERVEREILALVEKRRRDSTNRTDVLSLLI